MREFLTSGQVGNIELNAQKKIREDIQNRWEQLGFVEGLEGNIKENIATLYENEAKHLISEATASDNSGSFETVVFPIIRRVFSKLLANDIVSVQAMNLPVGKLFFILPVTSEREWEIEKDENGIVTGGTGSHKGLMGYNRVNRNQEGAIEPRYYLPDEVINEGAEVVKYMEKSLYDLFYNDFLFDNSKGKVTIKVGNAVAQKLTPAGMEPLAEDDSVALSFDGTYSTGNNVLVVTKKGYGLWYKVSEINPVGVKASGVKSINLRDDEVVSAMLFDDNQAEFITIITDKGTGKRMRFSEIDMGTRGNRGLMFMKEIKSNPSRIVKVYVESKDTKIHVVTDNYDKDVRLVDIPIMDRYSNGSYVVRDRVNNSYIEVNTLSKADFEGVEYKEEEAKVEKTQLSFGMLNQESLKEVDDRMVIINNFLDNIEGK